MEYLGRRLPPYLWAAGYLHICGPPATSISVGRRLPPYLWAGAAICRRRVWRHSYRTDCKCGTQASTQARSRPAPLTHCHCSLQV
jgi:hypothetical protein